MKFNQRRNIQLLTTSAVVTIPVAATSLSQTPEFTAVDIAQWTLDGRGNALVKLHDGSIQSLAYGTFKIVGGRLVLVTSANAPAMNVPANDQPVVTSDLAQLGLLELVADMSDLELVAAGAGSLAALGTAGWVVSTSDGGGIGATGPQGPAGADGQDGADGAQGPQGIQGPAGADGQDGADGAQGPQGIQGPAGADGQDGADGAQGPQGIQGPAGADGQDGADGAQGPQGNQGPAGADGQDGADGAQGPQGIQGPAGADGEAANIPPIIEGGDLIFLSVSEEDNGLIYSAVASDPDGNNLSFNLLPELDQSEFQLSTNGSLSWLNLPDYTSPTANSPLVDLFDNPNVYGASIEVTDGQGGSDNQQLIIMVTPSIQSQNGLNIDFGDNYAAASSTISNVNASNTSDFLKFGNNTADGATLNINTYGGFDTVIFGEDTASENGSVSINSGDGTQIYEFEGINSNGDITINAGNGDQSYEFDYVWATNLTINAGSGDQTYRGRDFAKNGATVLINAGAGSQNFDFYERSGNLGGHLTIIGNTGTQVFNMGESAGGGFVEIYGGDGEQSYIFQQGTGAVGGQLKIVGGVGDQSYSFGHSTLSGTHAGTLDITPGLGDQTFSFGDHSFTYSSFQLDSGDGNHSLTFGDHIAEGATADLRLTSTDGDTVYVFGDYTAHLGGSVQIEVGSGDDTITFGNATALDSSVSIVGSAGNKTVQTGYSVANQANGDFSVHFGDGNHNLSLGDSIADTGSALINLGNGNHNLEFGNFAGSATGLLEINLGDGNSSISMGSHAGENGGQVNLGLGNGDHNLSVGDYAGNLSITVGDGNSQIAIGDFASNDGGRIDIFVGNGQHTISFNQSATNYNLGEIFIELTSDNTGDQIAFNGFLKQDIVTIKNYQIGIDDPIMMDAAHGPSNWTGSYTGMDIVFESSEGTHTFTFEGLAGQSLDPIDYFQT